MARILKIVSLLFFLWILLLTLSINNTVSGFANSLYPGSSVWVYLFLLGVEIISVFFLWRGIFGGSDHLLFSPNLSSEDREKFSIELRKRLNKNYNIDRTELDPSADNYIEKCLEQLKDKADQEIKRTSERIFLATALSQNGRLDALIVLVSLCRLVWKISKIYNQKPHPKEIISLYSVVISSTFLALSFEELDISTEITIGFGEAFHAMTPAAMTGSIPFIGSALKKFTSSAIDGAANCYLSLRAGIITRNAYMYAIEGQSQPSRSAVFKEAGGLLLGMSSKLIDQFSKELGSKLWGVTKVAQNTTVRAGQSVLGGISKVGGGITTAGKLAAEAADTVQSSATGLIFKAGSIVTNTATQTGKVLARPFRKKNNK